MAGTVLKIPKTEVAITEPGNNTMSEFNERFNDYVGSKWYNRAWRKHKLNVAAKNLNKALQIAKDYNIEIGGNYNGTK